MSKNSKTATKKTKSVAKPKSAPKKVTKKSDNKKVVAEKKKVETNVVEVNKQPTIQSTPVEPVATEPKKEEAIKPVEEKKVEVKVEPVLKEKKPEKIKPHKEKKTREHLLAISKPMRLVTQIALLLAFVFTFITLFVPLKGNDYKGNGLLLSMFFGGVSQSVIVSTILVLFASVINLICIGITIKRQECKSYSAFISLFVDIALIIFNIKSDLLSTGVIVVAALGILFSLAVIILNLFPFIANNKEKSDFRPRVYLILSTCVFAILLATLFMPFNILGSNIFNDSNVIFLSFLKGIDFANSIFSFGAIFIVFILIFAIMFDNSLKYYLINHEDYTMYSKKLTWLGIFESAIFFLAVIVIRIISNYTSSEKVAFNTVTYLPFILTSTAVVIQCYFIGKNEPLREITRKVAKMSKQKNVLTEEEKSILKIRRNSIALIIIESALVGTLIGSFFLKFLAIKTSDGIINASYTAFDLILGFKNEAQSFTIVGYVFLVVGLASIILYVFAICALLSGAKSKTTLSKTLVIASYSSLAVLSLTSVYFLASIRATPKILAAYFPDLPLEQYIADLLERVSISSELMIPALALTGLMAIVLLMKPITKIEIETAKLANDRILVGAGSGGKGDENKNEKEEKEEDKKDSNDTEKVTLVENVETFDNCPTFTEIDAKKEDFDIDYANRKNQLFENPTLPKLVNYIVDYAQNSRLHLFYKKEDIATFLAGLASAKLSILQGMSGTGKTSLPKIFLEAIFGNCEIVEIESSWRDKNELLGYYNEFSRIYSPKKFTRALYKAKLNPSIVTFIVLDEMNLSRIEYYFSDFLSLMENEEDKREIRLLNNQIFNTYDNVRHPYLALKDNHTIMIPKNVWFVGTANRDESTFEISDKVYDRAYTMNFDHRAVSPDKFEDPMKPRFLEYKALKKLFDDAPAVNFSVEDNPVIKEVEKALRQYNISFGNRIARQIETFVRVYCNCFNKPEDIVDEAMETILLSKVVHKLEYKNVRNKDELIHTFKRLKLNRCVEFINKLEEEF